jgi:hypothetical protein
MVDPSSAAVNHFETPRAVRLQAKKSPVMDGAKMSRGNGGSCSTTIETLGAKTPSGPKPDTTRKASGRNDKLVKSTSQIGKLPAVGLTLNKRFSELLRHSHAASQHKHIVSDLTYN